jgi:hypothetical protein
MRLSTSVDHDVPPAGSTKSRNKVALLTADALVAEKTNSISCTSQSSVVPESVKVSAVAVAAAHVAAEATFCPQFEVEELP